MEGLARRETVQDNLAGATSQPVTLQGSGVSSVAAPTPPDTSFSGRINQQLDGFLTGKLQEAAKLKQERDFLDGQFAAQQGKAFEDVEMDGNKWALEGYRVVQAQTLSSGLLLSQEEEINQGGFETDPDTYRSQFTERVEGLISSAPDGRTGELVREQLIKQTPVLVQAHMKAHLQHREKQNFENLEQSIDVISRDVTAADQLVAFATGAEGSGTEGLSEARRSAAVYSGVQRAFDNDNPLAYATLSKAGLLNTDNMTAAQINSLRASKKRFENRRRQEFDEELFSAEQNLLKKVGDGELDPTAAAEALSSLYSEHHIEANKAEIGAIYHAAEDGIKTKKLTKAALLEDATLRGDRDGKADIIIDSLAGTESGGDFSANRVNVDGRGFTGRLQFGQARLDDFAKAVGGQSISLKQFRNDKKLQRLVERWHVKDILTTIEKKGYNKRIGTKINGVTVSESGLVAIAHLGGKGGLDKFIQTNGKYNPSDELGTSLTDYLRKHNIGETEELYTPQQKLAKARNILEQTRKAASLDAYEQFAPAVSELDESFTKNEISEEQWKQERRELQQQFGQARTAATINNEIEISKSVSDALQKQVSDQNAVHSGIALRQAEQDFSAVADAFATGGTAVINGKELTVTERDLVDARRSFIQSRDDIAKEFNIPLNPNAELKAIDGVVSKLNEAIDKRTKFDEGTSLIRKAEASGTLDQLSPELQQRAVKEFEQNTVKQFTEAAQSGNVTHEQAEQDASTAILTYFGKTGLVDPTTKQVVNGFLRQEWIKDGQPNPNVVEAVSNIRTITGVNPALLEKYIPDDDTRALVQTAINRAGGGPIENAIFSTRDNSNRPSQLADRSNELNLDKVERDLRAFSLNAANNTQVQVWGDIFQPKPEVSGGFLDHFSGERGVLGAIFSDTADVSQLFDRSSREFERLLDPDGDAQVLLRESVKEEARRLMTEHSGVMSTEEALVVAQQTIQTRGAFVGGDFVMFPKGESVMDSLFGSEAKNVDTVDAPNRAIMDYLRTEEMQKAYPYLGENSSFVLGTGVRPFRTSAIPTANGTALMVHVLDDHGGYTNPVVLSKKDLRKAGMNLVNKLRNN